MRRLLCLLPAAALSVGAAPPSDSRGEVYLEAPALHATVSGRISPQVDALLDRLLRDRRGMTIDGVRVFESGDKFLPGKIAAMMAYRILELKPGDPRQVARLQDFADIADLTLHDPNESWGIYYYISALHSLQRAGLLHRAVHPNTLQVLRRQLDWRRFVRRDLTLIDLPNNYYGVAFPIAGLRHLLGWEDDVAAKQLLARTIEHYRRYSGPYGFADETAGDGRFDRYSVLLIGELAQRMIETGMQPTPEVRRWLRRSVDLMLPRLNLRGEGWEYGRSIGAYGDTAMLETLTAAAKLKVLSPTEERMAYAFSSRIAARYMNFWVNPATGSVDLWGGGRRTDGYRGKYRIFGENLSLARQFVYTDAIWSELGYRGKAPDPSYARWLNTLPTFQFTWFFRGEYDRAVLTLRDGARVISLPIVNGAEGQHAHNPYFPVPFSPGLLQGAADAGWPQLTPQLTLEDGTRLMPLAFFKDVTAVRQGKHSVVRWHQDAWDRLGGKDAAADDRLHVETMYRFGPGTIERVDRITPVKRLGSARLTIELGSFSEAAVLSNGATFGDGGLQSFKQEGYGTCSLKPISTEYASTTGPMRSVIACARTLDLDKPVTLRWALTYRP